MLSWLKCNQIEVSKCQLRREIIIFLSYDILLFLLFCRIQLQPDWSFYGLAVMIEIDFFFVIEFFARSCKVIMLAWLKWNLHLKLLLTCTWPPKLWQSSTCSSLEPPWKMPTSSSPTIRYVYHNLTPSIFIASRWSAVAVGIEQACLAINSTLHNNKMTWE